MKLKNDKFYKMTRRAHILYMLERVIRAQLLASFKNADSATIHGFDEARIEINAFVQVEYLI